jgi:hypothetical protein
MRAATVMLLVVAALATGSPAAFAQSGGDPVSKKADKLPTTLFKPPEERAASPRPTVSDATAAAPRLLAVALIAAAMAAGFYAGSSSRTLRS